MLARRACLSVHDSGVLFKLLAILASTVISGCGENNSATSVASTSAGSTALVKAASTEREAASGATSSTPAQKSGGSDPSKLVSKIAGDRLSVIPSKVILSKQTESSPFRFAELARDAGIDFVHFSGMTDEKHFPTANGSGVAVFDHDNDGLLDIYFATATLLPLGTAVKGPNRLYKNLGGMKFKDVTEASGLGYRGFCHGIVAGDIDNDGDQDVFLCNYGSNVLYLNNGNGTYKDISQSAGIDKPNWSSGGAMLDYDNDGYLDIYVTNYGSWNYPDDHRLVGDAEKKIWLYSSPRTIKTVRHLLFHNNRNNTFTDVLDRVMTVEREVEDPVTKSKKKEWRPEPRADGHGFGVVTCDLNNDGLIDIFVANDMNPNFLFLNRGNGTFEDVSETSGAAYNLNGMAQSGMGVDAEDVNGDGLPELFVTNFTNEYSTLYQNHGNGLFFDSTPFFGLASDSMPWVKWGCALADFDSDGWPDCFFVNGHVDNNRRLLGQPVDYEEFPLLFRNMQGKRFRLATKDAGAYFDTKHVGRGAAFGDIDNDGDIDIVVNHKDAAPALLRNDSRSSNHWIRFALQGVKSNRDAIGAKLAVTTPERTIYRQRKGGYSMQGTNDGRVTVGIGNTKVVPKVAIRWPSGVEQVLENLQADQEHKIVEPPTSTPRPKGPAAAAGTPDPKGAATEKPKPAP